MKSLKKNQVIIFVIALMLISAGYFNYTANIEDSIPTMEYAGIGDAKLVNSNNVSNTINSMLQNESTANSETQNQTNTNSETKNENIASNTQSVDTNQVNAEVNTEDEYFTKSRLERDTIYSQMLESYQKILENPNIATDQKSIAQTEIKRINDLKNAIMICENLIKTKGFEDMIMFVNDKSISIIVKEKELTSDQIAQIQNIIAREMGAQTEDIHISSK